MNIVTEPNISGKPIDDKNSELIIKVSRAMQAASAALIPGPVIAAEDDQRIFAQMKTVERFHDPVMKSDTR